MNNPWTMRLSELLRRYRKQQGLTQKEFAWKCGLAPCVVEALEREDKYSYAGKQRQPRMSTLLAIAHTMGVPVIDVLAAEAETLEGGGNNAKDPTV